MTDNKNAKILCKVYLISVCVIQKCSHLLGLKARHLNKTNYSKILDMGKNRLLLITLPLLPLACQ